MLFFFLLLFLCFLVLLEDKIEVGTAGGDAVGPEPFDHVAPVFSFATHPQQIANVASNLVELPLKLLFFRLGFSGCNGSVVDFQDAGDFCGGGVDVFAPQKT